MEHEEITTEEEKTSSTHSRGLSIVVGGLLGYLTGKLILNKPVLGAALGLVLGFVLGLSEEGA